ncbi:MAG TPA: hypothetical protein VD864_15025 [Nocardioides sp.]|nr:hypothetical protein [Nocardioides sp.]
MARDVEADLRVNDRTGPGFTAAARRSERFSKDVERSSARLTASIGTAGARAGVSFGTSVSRGIAAAAPAAGAALAGAALYAAPLIGATLSGAIIGGAGIGGVIGGVMLAARDQRVQSAGKALAARFWSQMEDGARSFITPTLQAIADVEARMARMESVTSSIFSKSARLLRPLVNGALNFVESVGRGVDRALDGAGPVIASVERGLSLLGRGVEEVMASLSDDGIAAATALDQVFNVLYVTVRGVGAAINALTESYGFLAKSGLLGLEAAKQWILYEHAAKVAAATTDDMVPTFQRVQEAADGSAERIRALADAERDLRRDNLSLAEANTQLGASLDEASEAARRNGRQTSDNTAKGRANNTALQGLARSINAQREALERVNGVTPRTTAQAQTLRGRFIAAAESMGYSSRKARELADKLLNIPKKTVTASYVHVGAALASVRSLQARLNALPRRIQTTINVAVGNVQSAAQAAYNQARKQYGGDAGFRHAFAGPGGGMYRTGGPAALLAGGLTADVNVFLDGAPFAAQTAVAVRDSERRTAWRARTGPR